MRKLNDHMPSVALDYISAGKGAALATVISTWGSAPRPVGAQLAIDSDGNFEGSVSGGCVEGAVILEAQEAIAQGTCRVLEFGVADEDAFAVGLACGGNIKILVEPVEVGNGPTISELKQSIRAMAERRAFAYRVYLESWTREVIPAQDTETSLTDEAFSNVVKPRRRMVIVGAVHTAQSLSIIAELAGYEVFLIDPRDSFASDERFPNHTFLDGWPDEALTQLGLDAHTAVVTLSHDPKIDTPALSTALASEAFYIGALGSTRTHAKRLAELSGLGFSEQDCARIHGPVGLDLGAKTPAEIAVSIMAELTHTLRKGAVR